MGILLDTHAFLWWVTDDESLSEHALETIGDAETDVYVSAASVWEISTKVRIGKLASLAHVVDEYDGLMERHAFKRLAVTDRHAMLAGSFTHPHRDPFDRMLAAQSHLEDLPLVTRDPAIAAFDVELIW